MYVMHQPDTLYHCRVLAKVEDDWCVWRCVNKDVILLHKTETLLCSMWKRGQNENERRVYTYAYPDMRLNDEDRKDCYN